MRQIEGIFALLVKLINFCPGSFEKHLMMNSSRNLANMQQKLLIITTLILTITACSSTKKKDIAKQEEPKSLHEQIRERRSLSYEEVQRQTIEKTKKILDNYILDAQEKGEHAIKFLSNDLYIKAVDASMRGDSLTAVFLFEYVIKLNPEDDYLKRKYALELIRVGKLHSALGYLEKLFEKDKKDETLGLILGGVYTAIEKEDKARPVYQTVIKNNPQSEEACIFLAKSYLLIKKYNDAKSTLFACAKRMPKNPMFPYFLGKMEVENGQRNKAKNYFQRAYDKDPNFYQAVVALGLFFEDESKLDSAIKIYKKYLNDDPNNYAVLSRIVQVFFLKNDQLSMKARPDFEEMVTYVERLSLIDDSDLNLKVRLGIIYTDLGKLDKAKATFKEILVTVPDSDKILYYLGALYQNTEEYEPALEYFGKVNNESSLYLDSNLQIAKILHLLAKEDILENSDIGLKRFEKHVNKLSVINDDLKLELNVQLATFYEGIDNLSRSITILESLTELENWTESHSFYLASVYDKAQKFDDAHDVMLKLLDKDPNNAHALNFIGYSILERGEDYAKAYEYISKAVDLSPEDGYIRDSLGWYYYKTGEFEKALVEVKKAWNLVKTDTVITKHLAIIYKELKKYEKAKEFYMEALKYCKVESERIEVLDALQSLEQMRLPASEGSEEMPEHTN